jgi:hypothetical protein
MSDFRFRNEGSISLLWPATEEAEQWIAENIGESQHLAGATVIEHRFVADIINGFKADGLTVDVEA